MKRAIKNTIRLLYLVVVIPLIVTCIAAVTIVGAPIALIFALGVCPFATIEWAWSDSDFVTWRGCWKDVARRAFNP